MLLKITTGDVNHPPLTGDCCLKVATGDGNDPKSRLQSRPNRYGTPMESKSAIGSGGITK